MLEREHEKISPKIFNFFQIILDENLRRNMAFFQHFPFGVFSIFSDFEGELFSLSCRPCIFSVLSNVESIKYNN